MIKMVLMAGAASGTSGFLKKQGLTSRLTDKGCAKNKQ